MRTARRRRLHRLPLPALLGGLPKDPSRVSGRGLVDRSSQLAARSSQLAKWGGPIRLMQVIPRDWIEDDEK